jgi:4a-hydroxytetrahydrobiopterin dehydratase
VDERSGILSEAEVSRILADQPGWRRTGEALVRELRFHDFDEALAFVEQLARTAIDYGRRPDVSISSGRVRLAIRNLHRAGFTLAEMRLLAKASAVIGSRP